MLDNSYVEKLVKRASEINDIELNRLLKMFLEERKELIRENKKYEDMANYDSMTGLYNRRILANVHKCSSLAICDIDDFKQVNDTYGHDEGDHVIKEIARIIREGVREKDFVCRYGGDEFIIGFADCYQEDVVRKRLEQIQKKISEEVVIGNGLKPATISVGMVMNVDNHNYDDIKTLISKADLALYQSKKRGKSRVTQYDESSSTEMGRQI